MMRPIAVVFMIDPEQIPDYENKLPDLLAERIVKAHDGIDTDWLRCFQFPGGMTQDDVEEILAKSSVPWKDEAWRGENGTYMERLCYETGSLEADWEHFNGPETGVGVEHWLANKKHKKEAYVCIDQEDITISVTDMEDTPTP